MIHPLAHASLLLSLLLVAGGCGGPGQRAQALAAVGGGPERSVEVFYEGFDTERAMAVVEHGDRFYRAEGSDGYEAVRAHLRARLAAAGFGDAPHLELEELVIDPAHTSWTPRRGRLTLEDSTGAASVLHAFDAEHDVERLLLPLGAPACDVSGPVVLELRDVWAGCVLVTDAPARSDVLRRAQGRGAVAVLSSSLASYNTHPETGELLEDALRFRVYPPGADLPAAQISPASHVRIAAAVGAGGAHVRLEADAHLQERPLRMLRATVVGDERPDEVVVITSHIEYAGASDNASGFAATVEGATVLAEALADGQLPRPARSITFLWGPQISQAERWLEETARAPVAALTLLAAGDAAAYGGSPLLLERPPDPGAVRPLHPDEHTMWGARPVEAATLVPNGLAVIARSAMADVAGYVGGWRVADHPWEGGSDHDVFLKVGVPAALLWHFTPSWYHTSLDRVSRVDPEELRRSAATTLSAALAIADPDPADFAHYDRALGVEQRLRGSVAVVAGDEALAEQWRDWCAGARVWLAELCEL